MLRIQPIGFVALRPCDLALAQFRAKAQSRKAVTLQNRNLQRHRVLTAELYAYLVLY